MTRVASASQESTAESTKRHSRQEKEVEVTQEGQVQQVIKRACIQVRLSPFIVTFHCFR